MNKLKLIQLYLLCRTENGMEYIEKEKRKKII
jgi:hypothetical protein